MSYSLFNLSKSKKASKKNSVAELDLYSYSQNALLLKAKLTGKKRHIARAALSTFDWRSLAFCLKKAKPQKKEKGVTYVDVVKIKKKVASVESEQLEANIIQPTKKVKKSKSLGENVSDGQNIMDSAVSDATLKTTIRVENTGELKKIIRPSAKKELKSNWLDLSQSNYKKPIKLSDYTRWLNRINKEEDSTFKKIVSKTALQKKKKKETLKTKINKSIVINEAIVSEPLADLLFSQGHIKEATKMYKKLSLIFPEKSSFFADKIKALKK